MVKFSIEICVDSDKGRDILVQGTTIGPDLSTGVLVQKRDYCTLSRDKKGRLLEFYCDNGQVASRTFGPEDGCYKCINGACGIKQITKQDVIDYIKKDGINANITKEEAIKYVDNKCYGYLPVGEVPAAGGGGGGSGPGGVSYSTATGSAITIAPIILS